MSNSTNSTLPATAPPATNYSSSSNSTTTAASPPPQSPLPPSSPPPKSSSPPPSSTPTGQSSDQSPPNSPPPPTKSSDGSQSQSSSSSPPPPPPPPSPPGVTHSLAPPAPKLSSGSRSLGPPSSGSPSSNKSEAMVAAGGAFAAFILFALILSVCYCCRKKKKIDKPHNNMQYYNDTSGFQDNNYFMSGPDSQWMPESSFGKPPLYPGNPGGWQPQPPPPLPLMTSANMSSGGFSGPHGPPLPPPSPNVALGFDKSTFTYEELASATNNFNDDNLLGQGGFGYVHKGWLPNGKEIAVKQLKSGSGQGEREFQAEVDIISRVHHKHLVSLVGYCIAGAQRMLVYDFVPNNTLEFHLHSGPADKKVSVIDWPTRLKIAHGAAKGIAYLHEDCHPRIIHRDIKASNILLDENFEAMVADFGLAKLSADNHTHVSTRVMGTFGYLAPEYASSGKLTEKSDVYSYGVMLLEMITGRRPVDMNHAFMDDSLVDWARPVLGLALADGNYDDLADSRLQGNYDPMEMARMVASAAAAVRHSAKRRPKMSQIVRALEGEVSLEDLNEGMRPGQSTNFGSGSDYESSSYASNMRTKMRQVQMASPEYSGDYSEPVTGYARNSAVSSSDGEYSSQLKPNPRVRNL